jgi:ubiquinone/menaquinone biosynthesis C-methylase UbiE
MLDRARKQLPNTKLILWDIVNMIEIWDNTQDIVCLFQVLHHLNLENRTKVYNEINRILKPNWHVIIIASTPPESNKIQIATWNTIKRFYAVLSQHPDILLRKRINEAIKSILFPSNYNSEDFWYFPIDFDTMLWAHNELELIQSVTPKIICNTIPCISDMHIFQKTK